MKTMSAGNAKVEMIRIRRGDLKRLPRDVSGIEKWIRAMGGHKASPAERALLRKRGLIGMPAE